MIASDLVYPVIVFDRSGYFSVSADEDTLTTISAATLKKGGYTGCTIVDSEGRVVEVASTRFVSGIGPFWGYTLLLDRIIRVELTFGDSSSHPKLDELKLRVTRRMKIDGRSIAGQDAWRLEIEKISDARSVSEIANALLPQYDKRSFLRMLRRL